MIIVDLAKGFLPEVTATIKKADTLGIG